MKSPRRYAPMGGSFAPVRVAGFRWNGWQPSAVYAPYLDTLILALTADGLGIYFAASDAAFQTRFDEATGEAVRDLLDMQRIVGTNITRMGWDGVDFTLQPELVSALNDFGYSGFRINGDGTNASEVVIGDDTDTVLNGLGGNDLLLGGAGDDTLNGGIGNV
ncbi:MULTISPECIES: hypothetical protein [unclassified Marinobacter]|uniref:hypothetical protein n=1 Tax=unclassified Marinobacter TaxID=83889 RepID=UPI0020107A98|nr:MULTISPECIES: hypothetical protein [unclassified Marinobacter]MCL1481108.1 hypothetical protein [Marinobacter sp.]MCL1485492.1 hypothetical protein [Marinobacter sp.]MCL1488022.1 hypothetical protein [Marinobacter sp.]UQG58313.1 hypothetical protein MIH16_22225 [Marinobacter sp. M4C]UQG67122.1 hypothetical protein MIH17_22220 [Marinobacter sp. M2C]